jgi:N-acetylglucosamine-6-phosphate deacetylase
VPTTITTHQFFDGADLHGPSALTLEDNGIISSVDRHEGKCDHYLATPGLVDVQMNGWDDVDVAEADIDSLVRLDDALFAHGTSHWLGTIVTAPRDRMRDRLARLDSIHASHRVAGFEGVHMEGPFLGGAPGAHDRRHIVSVDPDMVATLPYSVRLVTLAPEAAGASDAIETLVTRGVCVSAGHSTPSRSQFDDAVSSGVTMVTHLFNGMSGVHHRDGGMALWAMLDERITLGLVADGHHVSADAVALAFRIAADRVCLVSDSVAWAADRATTRGVRNADGVAVLSDGTLAGSCTPLAGCVRWAVSVAGVPLDAALRAATRTPALVIGAEDLGLVRVGRPADLTFFDETLHVAGGVRRLASPRG